MSKSKPVCDRSYVEIISNGIPKEEEITKLKKMLQPKLFDDLMETCCKKNDKTAQKKKKK